MRQANNQRNAIADAFNERQNVDIDESSKIAFESFLRDFNAAQFAPQLVEVWERKLW